MDSNPYHTIKNVKIKVVSTSKAETISDTIVIPNGAGQLPRVTVCGPFSYTLATKPNAQRMERRSPNNVVIR